MYCEKCGTFLGNSGNFCKNCGSPINRHGSTTTYSNDNLNNNLNENDNTYASQMHGQQLNYNQPVQQKKNNSVMFVILGLVVLLVVGGGLLSKIFNNSNDYDNGLIVNNSTYKVKHGNFTYEIPNDYLYEVYDEETMIISDIDKTWFAMFGSSQGSYSTLKLRKNELKNNLEKTGVTVLNVLIKTLGGVEYITIEGSNGGTNSLMAYTKLNSSYILSIVTFNSDNKFNYSVLEKMSSIVKSAVYTSSNNLPYNSLIEKFDEFDIEDFLK